MITRFIFWKKMFWKNMVTSFSEYFVFRFFSSQNLLKIIQFVYERFFKFWYNASSYLIADMCVARFPRGRILNSRAGCFHEVLVSVYEIGSHFYPIYRSQQFYFDETVFSFLFQILKTKTLLSSTISIRNIFSNILLKKSRKINNQKLNEYVYVFIARMQTYFH